MLEYNKTIRVYVDPDTKRLSISRIGFTDLDKKPSGSNDYGFGDIPTSVLRCTKFEELPEDIQGKLSVLSMREFNENEYEGGIPDVGIRVNNNVFWVYM